MTPEYLAGFIDGEGCIDTQRMHPKQAPQAFYVRPRIRVSQAISGRIVVDRLAKKFGGNVSFRKKANRNQQDSVSWDFLDNAGIKKLLLKILPHLIVKREQAKLVLWWLDHLSGKHRRTPGYQKIEDARMLFADELMLMKRDPQRLSERAIARIKRSMR